MIGSNIYITNRFSYGSITPQFKQVIDYAKSLSFTTPQPGTTLYKALNTMVGSYVSEGVWDEWDIYYQFGFKDTTLVNFSTIDWRRLTTGSYQGGLAFVDGGIKGNAVNAFFNTNYNPSTQAQKYQLNNASRFAYVHNASGSGAVDGISGGGSANRLSFSNVSQNINNGTSATGPTGSLSGGGMKSIHRQSVNTRIDVYQGTVRSFFNTGSTQTISNSNQGVLVAGTNFGAHTISMYAMGSNLESKNTSIVSIFNQYTSSIQL
jgi:hypothetical protein